MQNPIVFKIILLGDTGVGKTSLMVKFTDGDFESRYFTTIGVDFRVRTVILDETRIKLQIWDTAGQERFRTITRGYYRGAQAVIFVYDITNRESYQHIQEWINDVHSMRDEEFFGYLVGSKADLDDQRQVPSDEALEFSKGKNMPFMETSSKEEINIDKLFLSITKDLFVHRNTKVQDSPITIISAPSEKKRCCK